MLCYLLLSLFFGIVSGSATFAFFDQLVVDDILDSSVVRLHSPDDIDLTKSTISCLMLRFCAAIWKPTEGPYLSLIHI